MNVLVEATWTSTCPECGRRGAWVCDICMPLVSPLGLPACERCGAPLLSECKCGELPDSLSSIRGAFPYAGWVRSSIHAFKFKGEFARSPFLAGHISAHIDLSGIDLLVPVPMHRDRLRDRGYNQSALLARDLGKLIDVPADDAILRRSVKRAPQVGRSGAERWEAIDGVFDVADPVSIAGKHVAIVDDVITTGATVSECSRVLCDAGAARVVAVAFALD